MRHEEEQLREQIDSVEAQKLEVETALESVRMDAMNKKAEQER